MLFPQGSCEIERRRTRTGDPKVSRSRSCPNPANRDGIALPLEGAEVDTQRLGEAEEHECRTCDQGHPANEGPEARLSATRAAAMKCRTKVAPSSSAL